VNEIILDTGEQLRAFRKSLSLTQKKFAERFGVSEITIRRLELGITAMKNSYTARILEEKLKNLNAQQPTNPNQAEVKNIVSNE
jgi:transcriptional regulator with XRE-family HTH domain